MRWRRRAPRPATRTANPVPYDGAAAPPAAPTAGDDAPLIYVFSRSPYPSATQVAAARDAYRADTGRSVPVVGIGPSTILAGVRLGGTTRVYVVPPDHLGPEWDTVNYLLALDLLLDMPDVTLFNLPEVTP